MRRYFSLDQCHHIKPCELRIKSIHISHSWELSLTHRSLRLLPASIPKVSQRNHQERSRKQQDCSLPNSPDRLSLFLCSRATDCSWLPTSRAYGFGRPSTEPNSVSALRQWTHPKPQPRIPRLSRRNRARQCRTTLSKKEKMSNCACCASANGRSTCWISPSTSSR